MADVPTEGFREGLEARELESAKNSPELLAAHQAATGVSDAEGSRQAYHVSGAIERAPWLCRSTVHQHALAVTVSAT